LLYIETQILSNDAKNLLAYFPMMTYVASNKIIVLPKGFM